MTQTVLHIYDPRYDIDTFMLANMMRVSRGREVVIHLTREGGSTDIVRIGRDGLIGEIVVAPKDCGCP